MGEVRVCSEREGLVYGSFQVLEGWWPRLRGLLGPFEGARPVLLVRCRSIHTFGMAFPIDVALVRADGLVVRVARALPAWRVLGRRGTAYVLERPASVLPWPSPDERIVTERVKVGGPECK